VILRVHARNSTKKVFSLSFKSFLHLLKLQITLQKKSKLLNYLGIRETRQSSTDRKRQFGGKHAAEERRVQIILESPRHQSEPCLLLPFGCVHPRIHSYDQFKSIINHTYKNCGTWAKSW
jgi:hypothetical protein